VEGSVVHVLGARLRGMLRLLWLRLELRRILRGAEGVGGLMEVEGKEKLVTF